MFCILGVRHFHFFFQNVDVATNRAEMDSYCLVMFHAINGLLGTKYQYLRDAVFISLRTKPEQMVMFGTLHILLNSLQLSIHCWMLDVRNGVQAEDIALDIC